MFLAKVVGAFQTKAKFPYYYVRSCPRCGSRQTGRYVKSSKNPNDNEWMLLQSLKNGEIVEFTSSVPEGNAFCTRCGFSWPEYIRARYVSMEYINNQKSERGTVAILDAERNRINEETISREKNGNKIMSGMRKFMGKI